MLTDQNLGKYASDLPEAPRMVEVKGAVDVSEKTHSLAHVSLEGELVCLDAKRDVQKEGESFQLWCSRGLQKITAAGYYSMKRLLFFI